LLAAAAVLMVAMLASAVVASPAQAGVSYVGRVASAKASNNTSLALKCKHAVAAGDAVMVSLMLGGSGTGPVTATDAAGNTYGVDVDRADGAGNRLLLLSSRNVARLASGATITINFPRAASSAAAGDEFAGIAGLDQIASSSGQTTAFSSGTATTTASGELLVGVAGTVSGGAATWASGWSATSTVGSGALRLGPAWRVAGAAGPYEASGTAGGPWIADMATYKAAPPPEKPPAAALTMTPSSGAPPLNVKADASGSTDTDSTPISSYTFDFGDGSAPVGPQSGATATHTYSGTGTFTAEVTVTDTAGLSSTATATVVVTSGGTSGVAVYAGYYDTHHTSYPQAKPSPWQGSSNTVFAGKPDSSSGGWDTSGVRIDNLTGSSLSSVTVTVDIGTHHFALWSGQSVPAGYSLIVAQTALENFDGSDTNSAGCYGCDPALCDTNVFAVVPVVHVTTGGVTTNYKDPQQILNTHGVDSAGCPDTGGTRNDESEVWSQLAPG
jgi:PKD repeat protein